jgi:hypothetical protein
MFLGHFALAFGAKRAAPRVSLGVLVAGAQFADLLWPILVLSGVERVEIDPGNTVVTPLRFVSYPYSHSLETLIGWGVLFGLGYALVRRARLSAAVWIAALVLSHWVLDVVTHRPDMPLTIHGATRVGLGMWNSLIVTLVVESILFAAGIFLYSRATRARNRAGSIGWWTLVIFLTVIYIGSVIGPPPPTSTIVAWSGVAMWLLVLWAGWTDRKRELRGRDA